MFMNSFRFAARGSLDSVYFSPWNFSRSNSV